MEQMQASLLDLNQAIQHQDLTVFKTTLTFRHFIDFLKETAEVAEPVQAALCRATLERFAEYPELYGTVPVEDMVHYQGLLDHVHALLTPTLPAVKQPLWAMSLPATPHMFYGTATFYNLLCSARTGKPKSTLITYSADQWKEKRLTNIYSMILEKLYGFNMTNKQIIHEITDEETGLTTYYRFNFDGRFMRVKSDIELPELSIELLQDQLSQQLSPVHILQSIWPLHHFTFEGFTVVTLTDITTEYTLDKLKELSMPQQVCSDPAYGGQIERALKTIAGNHQVNFGLLPFLQINGKIVFNHDISFQSLLVRMGRKYNLEEALFLHFAENYIRHPKLFFIRSVPAAPAGSNLLLQLLTKEGIGSYVAIPLLHKKQLVGVLEIYSSTPGSIDEKMMSKLDMVEPLLAQLMQYTIESVKEEIGHVINEKFTPLQPAVVWKFNEAAWQYIRSMDDQKAAALPRIVFENVFPLYGAIDVRNSTIERNNALKADLTTHFPLLFATLEALEQYGNSTTLRDLKEQCNEWMSIVDYRLSPYQSFKVEDYLYKDVVPFLHQVLKQHPASAAVINDYLQAIDQKTGIAYQRRRDLEASLQLINTSVGESLDKFNHHLQESFPCYFEKFRTDGVEYDVYAGSSITPGMTLTKDILKDIRKKQLTVMAHIARQAKELLPRMATPLQTTQLIFVHSTPIDIAFRNDERRFDVEGSYNIRYQVVKKRIDKAFIKNTSQRLTQPGAIAIVYFEQTEISDYLEGAAALQHSQILKPDIEWLELEDLQGVSGLKAIRLYINE